MHARIKQRRDEVSGKLPAEADAADINTAVPLIAAIELKLVELGMSTSDERVSALTAAIRSSRLIIEMTAAGDPTAADLLPGTVATLLHVHSTLLILHDELRTRGEK
jgi:hypothetical protein